MKFLADDMLGKLAKWLRILGYDTLYFNSIADDELLNIAQRQQRLILTRDTRLVKRRLAQNCLLIQYDHCLDQLKQLVLDLKLDTQNNLLSRCCRCNQLLERVEKPTLKSRIPPYVYQTQSRFKACPDCLRIYWSATHVTNILAQLEAAALSVCF